MAYNNHMEKSRNPRTSEFQLKRRRSDSENEDTESSRDISDLTMIDDPCAYFPTEILIKIFHYLEFSDILAARLCCKHWYHIINPVLASKRILKLIKYKWSEKRFATSVTFVSNIENLYLEDTQFGDVDQLLGEIGANLKTLTLQNVSMPHDCGLTFTHFPNLQSLKVHNAYARSWPKDVVYLPLGFGDLSQLKQLELHGNDLHVDQYLLNCSLNANFLKKLTLQVTKKLEVDILKILDKQAEILIFLDLYFVGQNDLDVIQWIGITTKLNLKELYLWNHFSRDIFVEMVTNQKTLRSLYLETPELVNDEFLTLIVQKLPQLRKLTLVDCHLVTNTGVEKLFKLSKLNVLEFDGCDGVTLNGIRDFNGQEACNIHLHELYMNYFRYLDENAISFCAKNLPCLRVLYLKDCRNLTDFAMVGDKSIRNLNLLERLSLRDCENLSDETLCAIKAPHLKFIDIRKCLAMTIRGISTLVKNCPSIEEFAFTCSNKEVFDVVTKGLSRLRTLTIDSCSNYLPEKMTNWKKTHFDYLEDEVIFKKNVPELSYTVNT